MKKLKDIYSNINAEQITKYFVDYILRKSKNEYRHARLEIAKYFLDKFYSENNARWLYENDFDSDVRKIGAIVLLERLSSLIINLNRKIKE